MDNGQKYEPKPSFLQSLLVTSIPTLRLQRAYMYVRLRKANEVNQWSMTAEDIAIYDAAFDKQDKDNDGFISPAGRPGALGSLGIK